MTRPMYRHPGPAAARLRIDVHDQDEPVEEIDLVRWAAQMRADVAETVGGVMLRAARPVQLTVLPSRVSTSPGRLVGWSLRIPVFGANPAVLKLHDGGDAAADLVAVINLAATKSDTTMLPGGGVSFSNGLYVEIVTSGGLETAVEGCIYLGAAD